MMPYDTNCDNYVVITAPCDLYLLTQYSLDLGSISINLWYDGYWQVIAQI